jgi:2-oxoisovalerate dehydrogenase E1 component
MENIHTLNELMIERITAKDSFIPLGKAAYQVLPSAEEIVDKVIEMVGEHHG